MFDYCWDSVIGSIVYPRLASAVRFGVTRDDLFSVGRVAAVEAERSWSTDGGRSLRSWVYLNVSWGIADYLKHEFSRNSAEFCNGDLVDMLPSDSQGVDSTVLISQALDFLRAELSDSDWSVLWLRHAEGCSVSDIAADLGLNRRETYEKLRTAKNKSHKIMRCWR